MCLLPPKALVTISNTRASLTTPRSSKAPATARKDAPLVTSTYAPLGYPAGAENKKTKIKYATPDHAIALMATFSNMSRSRYHLAIPWYCLWNVGKCLIQSIPLETGNASHFRSYFDNVRIHTVIVSNGI